MVYLVNVGRSANSRYDGSTIWVNITFLYNRTSTSWYCDQKQKYFVRAWVSLKWTPSASNFSRTRRFSSPVFLVSLPKVLSFRYVTSLTWIGYLTVWLIIWLLCYEPRRRLCHSIPICLPMFLDTKVHYGFWISFACHTWELVVLNQYY